MCIFWTLIIWELHFKVQTSFEAQISCSLFPTSKLLSMAFYGGELLLNSYSPWSGVSSQLLFFSITLPLKFKKQRTPLMKRIQGLQPPMEQHHVVSRASSSRWCSFASFIFFFGEFSLIPCSSSYSPCISSIVLWFGAV